MSKSIHLSYHSVFFFLMLCIGCTKENTSPPKPEYIGLIGLEEAKDYLYFKSGSFWVYKNSHSNELDTIVLTNSNISISEFRNTNTINPDPYEFDSEYLTYNSYSLRDSATYNTYCSNGGISSNAPGFYKIFEFQCERKGGYFKNTPFNKESTIFFYPFYTSEHNRISNATCLGKIDSVSLNSKTYYEVVSFSVEQDVAYLYPNFYVFNHGTSIYHWAKNIGLIKIEHQSYDRNMNVIKFNWELIDCHVIK